MAFYRTVHAARCYIAARSVTSTVTARRARLATASYLDKGISSATITNRAARSFPRGLYPAACLTAAPGANWAFVAGVANVGDPPTLTSHVERCDERYLAGTGPTFSKTLSDIMATGKFHALHEVGLLATASAPPPDEDPIVERREADEARMRIAYLAAMDEMGIDVLAIPTAAYPPKLNGDRDIPTAGTRSGIASALHWPAVVVPMGHSYENLPSGLQLIGRPWSEPILIGIAYSYEQATQHRVPPSTVPPLLD